jgi:hypothetical protein
MILFVAILPPLVLVLIGVVSIFHFVRQRHSHRRDHQETSSQTAVNDDVSSHDVWAERQRRGITGSAPSNAPAKNSNQGSSSRPFGSSYYYAHNNPQAKGGYKDGLRMEDYAMNGPRLLTRNSSAALGDGGISSGSSLAPVANGDTDGPDEPGDTTITAAAASDSKPPQPRRVISVTQYPGDDPGTGTATIRIDQLPHPTKPGVTLPWKEVRIAYNARAVLTGDGLEAVLKPLKVTSLHESSAACDAPDSGAASAFTGGGRTVSYEYRLSIPKLYGPVNSVTVVSKPSRLLLRLEKRTRLFDRSNAKPWPHPHKKLL